VTVSICSRPFRNNPVDKILICAKATKHIIGLLSETDFAEQLAEEGYSVMHITSKHGAFIDGDKVNREVNSLIFSTSGVRMPTRSLWFCITAFWQRVSISLLWKRLCLCVLWTLWVSGKRSVGHCVCTPKMPLVSALVPFTAGDLPSYTKSYGLVICPTFDKVSAGTAQKVQTVVDIIFQKGDVAISTINR
jgi:hypothetical protein